MKVIECRGSHARVGQAIGEGLREEIREHISGFVLRPGEELVVEILRLRASLETQVPCVLEQMAGMAAGAGVSVEEVLALNLPQGVGAGDALDVQGCTNLVFGDGPDGPLWGKNNDGAYPPSPGPVVDARGQRPVAVLKLYPDDGVPALCVAFCGWLSGADMFNAEGVAVGHSSVGSRLQQSRVHTPILQWMYWAMLNVRSAPEYVRMMTSRPTLGKGFSQTIVDSGGRMYSGEFVCPLAQIRRPEPGAEAMNCVNCYQLPFLEGLDRRTPDGLANAHARRAYLERAVTEGDRSTEHMREILRHHGDAAICRHGGRDRSHTEYSVIAVTRERRLLVADGNPCESEYAEVTI